MIELLVKLRNIVCDYVFLTAVQHLLKSGSIHRPARFFNTNHCQLIQNLTDGNELPNK